jgi:hypothetical protein
MNVKLNRMEFTKKLRQLEVGRNKVADENGAYYTLTNKGSMFTYNGAFFVSVPFDTGVTKTVGAPLELFKIVNNMTDDEIALSLRKDGKGLSIKGAGSSAMLTITSDIVERYPAEIPTEWKALPVNFTESLSYCMMSAIKEYTESFQGYISCTGKLLLSCDGVRLTRCELSHTIDEMLIPVSFVIQLLDIKSAFDVTIESYAHDEAWVHFLTNDQTVISYHKVYYTFPETEGLFDVKGIEIELPDNIDDIVKEVAIMSPGTAVIDKKVEITITPTKVVCKAENEKGWFTRAIDHTSPVESNVVFTICPGFLSKVAKETNTVIIGDRALFHATGFKHVVALFVKDEEEQGTD